LSIGSVATAFETVCPTRLDLLHSHYRRLCRVIVDVDEWGQVNLLELLIRYARSMLPRPTVSHNTPGKEKEDVDPDLELLLASAEPLFQSRNPAVRKRDSSFRMRMGLDDLSGRNVSGSRILLPSSAVTAS
jgi:AP-3 complex subunit beta